MRRERESVDLPKEDVLKIDKDCFVDAQLNGQYVESILNTCKKHGITVLSVKSTKTRHGMHFYIKIDPPVDAVTANNLQYLLGDDSKRVDFNRARIESGLVGWNKLFERIGARLRTTYRQSNRSKKKQEVRHIRESSLETLYNQSCVPCEPSEP
jgi:hypothetical protein